MMEAVLVGWMCGIGLCFLQSSKALAQCSHHRPITNIPAFTTGTFSNFISIGWGPPHDLMSPKEQKPGADALRWLIDLPRPQAGPDLPDLWSAMVATREARFERLGREAL